MKLKNNVKYKLFINTDVSLKDTKLETPPKSIARTCNFRNSSSVKAGR